MDIQQMYNHSAMLHDAFVARANESKDDGERQKFNQLASDQQAISDRLTPNQQQQVNQQQANHQQVNQQTQQQQVQNPDSPHQ